MKKAWVQGRDLPILLVMNYSRFLFYPNKKEYLSVTFEMIKHGEPVAMAPRNLGGDEGLYVDE